MYIMLYVNYISIKNNKLRLTQAEMKYFHT